MKSEYKSPIKGEPLRYPGQSLDEQMDKVLDEDVLPYLLVITLFIFLAISEWIRYLRDAPYSPYLYTFIAFITTAIYSRKIYKSWRHLKLLKQGRDGERVVGQYLDDMRNDKVTVFHDIVGKNFNIDHVLVSTKGVFAVETKTYSKPTRGEATITYADERVLVQGKISKKNIIKQAEWNQESLYKIIADKTGRKFPIRSVVLFPGWYVENKGNHSPDSPWVLNPKAFPSFHANQKEEISIQDYELIKKQLRRHIRQTQKDIRIQKTKYLPKKKVSQN